MNSVDLQVLAAARRWAVDDRRFALVTVARTWGSAPRPPGSWLALRDDGRMEGSVSGGCIEDDLISRMREGRLGTAMPFKLTYGVTRDDAARFGLPCGGTLELVVEPAPDPERLDELATRLTEGGLALRHVDLTTGKVTVSDAVIGDTLAWDGEHLITVHGPQWRLLVIGAGQITRYLAPMAQALDYQVIVCDPRPEYRSGWNVPDIALVSGMPDDVFLGMQPDSRCAIVALTHDPRLDDMVLLEALKSAAFYVGALGSRLNNTRRRERLARHFGLSEAQLARLHGPVGLPIGSHTPPEIAVAIVAEMTAVKHGMEVQLNDGAYRHSESGAAGRAPTAERHPVEQHRWIAAGCRK